MTTGAEFVKAITSLRHIGPRTRRYRDSRNMREVMLADVLEAVEAPFMFSDERSKTLQAGWTAVCAYWKHIDSARMGAEKSARIKDLSPYQFAKFLGRMIDAGISNMYEAELWLADVDV